MSLLWDFTLAFSLSYLQTLGFQFRSLKWFLVKSFWSVCLTSCGYNFCLLWSTSWKVFTRTFFSLLKLSSAFAISGGLIFNPKKLKLAYGPSVAKPTANPGIEVLSQVRLEATFHPQVASIVISKPTNCSEITLIKYNFCYAQE